MKAKQKSKTKKKENLKKLERITHQKKLFHSENWGGSREGAGRKPLYVSDLPRKTVSFYLDEAEKAFLRQQLQKYREDNAKMKYFKENWDFITEEEKEEYLRMCHYPVDEEIPF